MPTTRFSKLQVTRPPTPPLEHEDFELDACETGLELLDSKHLVYNTPDDSPNPTSDFAGKSPVERSAKRVGFALVPSNIEDKKRITSRLEELKPKRSILKHSAPTTSDTLSSDLPPAEELNFFAMLDQLVKGLASQDISARYDAYMSINGCLRTYADTPSRKSLAGSMSTLDSYIRRDLVLDASASVKASQTITEALKFVTQLCWFSETKSSMTAGFQVFLLNHAITVLGKEDTSKSLVNLYLYFLSIQTFPSRVMNQEKVIRILSVTKGIAGRVQSRQAIAHRLAIYRRLITQAKGTMATKASLWMEDLLNNMLSRTKMIRERAIALGFVTGQCYGSEADSGIADAIKRLTNSKKSQSAETKYIDDVILRLQGWLDSKQNTVDIPAIWSIVILLLRSRPNYPKQWEHLPQWLRLIQGCLNINDPKTRSEANLAWIRLIYIIRPEANTAKSFSNLLFRPMKKQLERQEREKDTTGELRKNVDGAYVTLLYYAFRPGTDFQTLDRYWHEYIIPVFAEEKGLLIDHSLACQILISLFGCTQRPWQTDRALDTTCILTASELSRIDCKWIRSRVGLIVSVLEKYIPQLDPEVSNDDPSWKNVWIAFLGAIQQAGAKEIKVSSETMDAMAELLNVLQRSATSPGFSKLPQGMWIIDYLYRQLGSLPFLEERIIEDTENRKLLAIPSSSDRAKGAMHSPLNILVRTMLKCTESINGTIDASSLECFSHKYTAYFTTAATLMQAGYKQLPVHIRHSTSGLKYSKILDELLHARQDFSSDLGTSCKKLYDFASWLQSDVNGMPLTSLDSVAGESNVQMDPAKQTSNEEVIIVPRTTSAEVPSGQNPLAEDTGPDVIESTDEKITHLETVISTPKANSRRQRGPALQQQPRIRHDNSQIEFASIDSSPSILKAFDSQLLTERQKEVKERQNDDAGALFRDISSSTGPKLRTINTPRLQLSGHDRAKIDYERCGSSSPILPPGDSMMVFLSSPTPNERRLSTKGDAGLDFALSDSTSQVHVPPDDLPSSPPMRALEVLQALNTATHEEITHMPGEVDNFGNFVNSIEDASMERHIYSSEELFCNPAMLQLHLPSNQLDISVEDATTSLQADESVEEQVIEKMDAPVQEADILDDPDSSSHNEDDDLISSQIDQDLKRASQDTVFVDSPRQTKCNKIHKEQTLTPERKSPRTTAKRMSPVAEETVDHEPPRKRIRIKEPLEAEQIEQALGPRNLVSELQTLLEKARSGLDAQQGLAILQMSAELTQLAVKAIQG